MTCRAMAASTCRAGRILTALVLVAREPGGILHVWPHFWAPQEGLRERAARDHVPYDIWARQGLLTTTPGRSIDFALVPLSGPVDAALQLAEGGFRPLADRRPHPRAREGGPDHSARAARPGLQGHGASPGRARGRRLEWPSAPRQSPDPALECRQRRGDARPGGNRKLDKSRATGRIDGLVALAMAVRAAVRDLPAEDQISPWEHEDFTIRMSS